MSKISGSTGALIQGVSQQPEGQRLAGQCWEQINFSSSASDGLTRRPGTFLAAKLGIPDPTNCAVYFYRRGEDEAYCVIVDTLGVIRVWDKDWVQRTVSATDAAYLTFGGETPDKCLSFYTIGDVTYIANKHVKIAVGAALSPAAPAEALVNCMKGNYSRNYIVSVTWTKIDTTVVNTRITYTTRDSSNAAYEVDVSADNIATKLYDGLAAALTSGEGWTVTKLGNVVYLKREGHGQFTIGGYDGNNDQDMVVITKSVSKYANLPNRAVNGYMVQVQGKTGDDFNDYWLIFNAASESEDGHGKWKECVAPNIALGEDPASMPHILLRKANGTLKFGAAVDGFDTDLPNMHGWAPRACGDDDSNPMRSYIGYGVNDIGTFQDRLVFLVDENVVMSRSRDYMNFYKESATATSDADPIDIASSENEVATLRHMTLYNKALVVFSDATQFMVPGSDVVKYSTAVLQAASNFDSSMRAAPVPSGTNVFFATKYGEFSGIREFFIESQTDNTTSTLTTQHVDRYLSGEVTLMCASTNINLLLVKTTSDERTVYAYDYYWQGNKKVQSSWSKLTFPADVVGMFIEDTDAVFLLKGAASLYVLKMDMTRKPTDGISYNARLDAMQRVAISGTHVTIPTNMAELGSDVVILGCDNTGLAGRPLVTTKVSDTVYALADESITGDVWVGVPFDSYYRLTVPGVKDQKGHTLMSSHQQLMYLLLNVVESGSFDAITTVFGVEYTTTFEPFILEYTDLVDSAPPLQSDTFKVPIRAEATAAKVEFKCNNPYPLTIVDIEWVINMRQKGRRV